MYSVLDYLGYPDVPNSKQASFGDLNGMATHDSRLFQLFVKSRGGFVLADMRLPTGFMPETATLMLSMEHERYVIQFHEPVQYAGRGQMLRLLAEEEKLFFDAFGDFEDFLCTLAMEEEENEAIDEVLSPGVSDIYYTIPYPDQEFIFHFNVVDEDPIGSHNWKAYILDPIDYQGRDTSLLITHRLHHNNRMYSVCWKGKIHTKEEMLAVLQVWSHATAIYIREGKTIDETQADVAAALGLT